MGQIPLPPRSPARYPVDVSRVPFIAPAEGRKSHAEERPKVVDLVKRLHKQGMSYRAIGGELAKAGHVNERGRPFHHKSMRTMLDA